MKLKNSPLTEQRLETHLRDESPRLYLSADIVLISEDQRAVCLVKRDCHPYLGQWALPGGFAHADVSVQETAIRVLKEKIGVAECSEAELEEIGVFSKPGRDPRGWVVSESYLLVLQTKEAAITAAENAQQAGWFKILYNRTDRDCQFYLANGDTKLRISGAHTDLAFDHAEILQKALSKFYRRRKEWIYE